MTSHLSPLPASADAAVSVASGELSRSARFTSHASGASLLVADNLRFDSRLALIHEQKRWLAVADLHYGYELSFRARGALFPEWGRRQIEERMAGLISDYRPHTLILLGDLVHTKDADEVFADWIQGLRAHVSQIVLLRGNHDRRMKCVPLLDEWRCGEFLFHHGDREIVSEPGDIVLSGHFHPAETVSDGAGLRQSLPALCHTERGWILPAFSPWSAGGRLHALQIHETWITNQKQIWKIRGDLSPKIISTKSEITAKTYKVC